MILMTYDLWIIGIGGIKLNKNEINRAKREDARAHALVSALDLELSEVLDIYGVTLLGIALRFGQWESLITLKADIGGVRSVAFTGSDTPSRAILKALSMAQNDSLRWREDRYNLKKP